MAIRTWGYLIELEHEKFLVNLIRDRWVTDNEIERLLSILNKPYDRLCV